MSNEIVPYQDIEKMATVLGKSKLFGKTAEDLLPLMLIAAAEGKHPAIAAQEYDIIQGRPALNSRSALARFQQAGGKIQWNERSDKRACATFSHPAGGSVEIAWDMERAKQAQLAGKDNWKKFPAQMLAARVVAEGVRACFPACLSGFYTVEEVADFEPPPYRVAQTAQVTGTVIEAEQVTDDDTTKSIQGCTTIKELQAAWEKIPNTDRPKYQAAKEEAKKRLMEVQDENSNVG